MAKLSFSLPSLPSLPGFSYEGSVNPETKGAISTRLSFVSQLVESTPQALQSELGPHLFQPEVNATVTGDYKPADVTYVKHVANGALAASAHQEKIINTNVTNALQDVEAAHDNPGPVQNVT